jgi:hypothetical protein
MATKSLTDLMYRYFRNAVTGVAQGLSSIVGGDGTTVASAANPVPVRTAILGTTGTSRNITATTTSQSMMSANTARQKFFIRNDSAVDVWINFGGTAVASAGSSNVKIATGTSFEFAGYTGAVTIIAASATAAVTGREF